MTSPTGKILITGASGHLGSNLMRRLLVDGQSLRVLLRKGSNNDSIEGIDVERVFGDLRDPIALQAAVRGCDRIYHCAAKVATSGGRRIEREVYECNVIGTQNLLEAALQEGVSRVVVSGSFSAVGYDPKNPSSPSDETMPFYPFDCPMPYSASKALVEQACWQAAARGVEVVVAISTGIIGPHDYKPSRIGCTLLDFARGKMRAYVPGGFEFVAARDIVEGHVLAMERGRSGERYLLSTQHCELDELLDMFAQVTGARRPRLRIPPSIMSAAVSISNRVLTPFFPDREVRFTPGAIRILRMRRHADCSKAQRELGYRPTNIADAVREAFECFVRRGLIDRPYRVQTVPLAGQPRGDEAIVDVRS